MESISDHITYVEATNSETAMHFKIKNEPDEKQLSAMALLARMIFEPLRNHFNIAIGISSFFRCEELNNKVGGSASSQHVKGEAMDIDAHVFGGVTNKEIFQYIKNNLNFDQLIAEFPDEEGEPDWVHVSYTDINRRQVLVSNRKGNKTVYERIA